MVVDRFGAPASASHQGHEGHGDDERHEITGTGQSIPGATFQVLRRRPDNGRGGELNRTQTDAAVETVIETFAFMMQHRTDYPAIR